MYRQQAEAWVGHVFFLGIPGCGRRARLHHRQENEAIVLGPSPAHSTSSGHGKLWDPDTPAHFLPLLLSPLPPDPEVAGNRDPETHLCFVACAFRPMTSVCDSSPTSHAPSLNAAATPL